METNEHIVSRVNGGKVKWQAVKKYLISEMSSGRYSSDDPLPTEADICQRMGLARNTVRQAFDHLEKEGLIYRVRGKGTFLASADREKTSSIIKMYSLVVPGIRRTLCPSLAQGFDDALFSSSLQTLICQTNNDVNRQGNVIMQLLHRGVDGVALLPVMDVETPAFQIELLIDHNIPVVVCHRPVKGVDVPLITWDWEEVGRMAGRLLLENGHENIVYYGVSKYAVTEAHVRGLQEVLGAAGCSMAANRIIWEPQSEYLEAEKLKQEQLASLLSGPDRPTAIMCNDDTEAERVYWLIHEMGLKVPKDISIIGFGNSYRDSYFCESLTSITIDERELGHVAAKLLCDIKSGKHPLNYKYVHKMDLGINQGVTLGSVKK